MSVVITTVEPSALASWYFGDHPMRQFTLPRDENGRWSAERERKNVWGQEASGGQTRKSSAT